MKYLNSFIISENKEFGNYCSDKISFIEDHFIDLKDDFLIKHYWKE